VCDTRRMNEHAPAPTYKRHRFPPEIIGDCVIDVGPLFDGARRTAYECSHRTCPSTSSHVNYAVSIIAHAVWLYFRFALSYRDVEELLAERGVIVTYETIRQWCQKFGQAYANELRRRRPRPGDKWHLDEVFVSINGVEHYLWRAGDQDGTVLDILVQPKRDKRAAVRFLRQLLKDLAYVPRVVITDKLASYGAALREVLPSVEHRRHKGLNNRAENSHQPTRERERRMRRFKDPGHAQRFLAAYGPIASHFRPRRHRLAADAYRETRDERFATWRAVTGVPVLA
jgi:putative transposase